MEITEYLTEQHDEMRGLIERFDTARDGAARKQVAQDLFDLWSRHGEAEEETLYARMRSADLGAEDEIKEGIAEHDNGEVLFEELLGMDASDPMFRARFEAVAEVVEHHLDEEEEDLFPEAREHFDDDELAEIGHRYENRFRTYQLKAKTVDELREEAREVGVSSVSDLTKDELIAAIQGALHAKAS